MPNLDGSNARKFQEIAKLGISHFQNLYKAPERDNLEIIINLATYFLRFVSEESNDLLLEEVSKKELKFGMASFQKDNISSRDGWKMEFFY